MEQRNLIMAIVMSVSILLGWQILIEAPRMDQERARLEAEKAQKAQESAQQTQPGAPPVSAPGSAPPPATVLPPGTAPSAPGVMVPGTTAPVAGQPAKVARDAVINAAPRVKITTGRVVGSIRLKGAVIDDLTLLDYRQTLKKDSKEIVLLTPQGTENPYFAQFGWVAQTQGISVPGPNTVWAADREFLSVDTPVTLSWTNPDGIVFRQTITIDENYMFTVRQRIENRGSKSASIHPFGLISLSGTPEVTEFFILHEGLIGAFGETLTEIDYDDLQDETNGIRSQATTGGWIGITSQYFATSLAPDQKTRNTSRFVHTAPNGKDKYQVDYLAAAQAVKPGQTVEFTTRLFAGAKEVRLLDSYRDNLGLPIFDKLVDFGWFYYLTKPIFYAIDYFNRVLGNFGLAILLLTVLIKIAFFPLANKSYRSMSRLKKLQPKMVEVRERYKDDKQRQNQAMMEMYKKEGANPMSGCFPILIQIPVFFALYKVLFVTIEMRHAPFFGWIQDLSAPDPLGLLTAFGIFSWDVPGSLQIVNIGIWPIIMGLTMFLQQKLNPQPADPMQQKIFMFLPFVFTFLLGQFPAGLVIYWAWNNLLSIAQQWLIMRQMGISASGEAINEEQLKAPPRGNKKKKKAEEASEEKPAPAPKARAKSKKSRRKRKKR